MAIHRIGERTPQIDETIGSPATVLPELDEDAIRSMHKNTAGYVERRGVCKDGLVRLD